MNFFNRKKNLLFIILPIGCISLFLFSFIVRNARQEKTETSLPEAPRTFELTDAILTKLLLEEMPKGLPVTDLVVRISDMQSVELNFNINSSAIDELTGNAGTSVKFLARLLPENVPVYVKVGIDFDLQTQALSITPLALSINEISLPGNIIPDDLKITVNNALNAYLKKDDRQINSVSFKQNAIIITYK